MKKWTIRHTTCLLPEASLFPHPILSLSSRIPPRLSSFCSSLPLGIPFSLLPSHPPSVVSSPSVLVLNITS
ncbi:hypothetical protein BD310DRAFT_927375 [Dichomitus squalens]|uniref:Uncharacterized protein n=1 Tax=Dichomitus squalens TaxID=114155 RepID=A0A4Q9PV83_9APHY|nr:hypothetical protein BD310DRAFT_927375 [Dichomitus squalens]